MRDSAVGRPSVTPRIKINQYFCCIGAYSVFCGIYATICYTFINFIFLLLFSVGTKGEHDLEYIQTIPDQLLMAVHFQLFSLHNTAIHRGRLALFTVNLQFFIDS